jgi:hypothetical protein
MFRRTLAAAQDPGPTAHRATLAGYSPVIDMVWRELEGQQLPRIIDDEMECERASPWTFCLSGPALEDLVGGNPAVMTDRQHSRVDERNACVTALSGVQITTQGDECLGHQLNKAGVADKLRKIRPQIGRHMCRIIMFERPVVTAMEVDE